MPEGPSLVILKEEAIGFRGRKVLSVSGNSKAGIEKLRGRKIIDILSWGKNFLIVFKGFYVKIHLMMFGSYRINETRPGKEPRLCMRFVNGEFNFYSCSVKLIDGSVDEDYDWTVDTMSPEWDHAAALEKVKRGRSRIISDVLLDQQIFAGVGNIIKCEALFIARIHPEAKVSALPAEKLNEITKVAREYCFDFYRWKKKFELRKHWKIYRKSVCPRCNLKVIIKYVGETDRRTFFCPNCQFKNKREFDNNKIKEE